MTTGRDPDRALFADELRAMRKAAGLTRDELGARVGYSGATIGMVESMHRAPPRGIGKRLDVVFNLPGTFHRMEERLRGIPLAVSFRPFEPYEATAKMLRTFEHSLIPGLLQTERYMRAVLETYPGTTAEEVSERAAGRLARQLIFEREDPAAPMLLALLDETVLYREVGSPEIMHEQLSHLIEVSARPNITIQLIPSARAHAGALGSFVIADFSDMPGIVFLEDASGGRVAEDPATVEQNMLWFDSLRSEALPKGVSRDQIGSAAEQWEGKAAP